jgi:hypothetical protein
LTILSFTTKLSLEQDMIAAVFTLEPKSLAILFKEMICLGVIVIVSNKFPK